MPTVLSNRTITGKAYSYPYAKSNHELVDCRVTTETTSGQARGKIYEVEQIEQGPLHEPTIIPTQTIIDPVEGSRRRIEALRFQHSVLARPEPQCRESWEDVREPSGENGSNEA